MTGKRFVSWAAVSSLPQAKKISLEDQLATNRAHVARHGGTLIAELVVPGESRSIVLFEDACARIEAYAQLRDLIARRAFEVLIYLDRSRLGRKASLSMAVVELCAEAGISTYETESPPASLDMPTSSLDNMLLGAIKSVQAQSEVNKIRHRQAMGMRARHARGLFVGRPPYGYYYLWHPNGTKTIEIEETEAEGVRHVFDRYVYGGATIQDIGAELDRMGHRPRRSELWNKASVRMVLDNAWLYAGYSLFKGKRAKAVWQPLISEEVARAAEVERKRRSPARRSITQPEPLTHVLVCGYCGKVMSRHKRGVAFICANRCVGSYVVVDNVMPAVEAAIRYLSNQATLDRIAQETPARGDAEQAQLAKTQRHLEALQVQRERLTLAFTRDIISLDEYERAMAGLAADIQRATQQIDALAETLASYANDNERGRRLEEIRDAGFAMLYHEDTAKSNAWMRRHFRITIKYNRVYEINYL